MKMLYRGTFKNKFDEDITVLIRTGGSSSQTTYIGNTVDADIQFASSPVTIECSPDDTRQAIQMKSCTISLVMKHYLGDSLFTSAARDIIVNVWKNEECLFAGYAEPNVYSQPYNHTWDSLDITATCALSTLQYYRWRNITTEEDYRQASEAADSMKVIDIIRTAFGNIGTLDLLHGNGYVVLYDGSVLLSNTGTSLGIFEDVSIFEKLLLGKELDDVKMCDEILEMILMYFNLHIRQDGLRFYIWNWASIRSHQSITWIPLLGGTDVTNIYTVSPDSHTQDWREVLVNSVTGQTIPGNRLSRYLSTQVEKLGDNYVRYYYYTLPNGQSLKSDQYEIYDPTDDMTFIRLDDGNDDYRILEQSPLGDYDASTLEDAPDQAYDSGQFVRPYYEVDGHLIAEK